VTPDFERAFIDFLFRGDGLANDFDVYAPPKPSGPERIVNAVSIQQDVERVLGKEGLERLAARARAERWPWSETPPVRADWNIPFALSVSIPAPAGCRIILTE